MARLDDRSIVRRAGAAVEQSGPLNLHCDAPVTMFIVDDNAVKRDGLRDVLEQSGYTVECYASGADFVEAHRSARRACLLVDAVMPDMSGIELIRLLKDTNDDTPAVVISGHAAISLAVQAMKAGAVDFIEKPVRCDALLANVERALAVAQNTSELAERRRSAAVSIAGLTKKQAQILGLVVAGHPSKNIAADLGISQRTVDNHRAAIMRKTGSKSLAALIQTAVFARWIEDQRNDHPATIAAPPRRVPAIECVRSADAAKETPASGISLVSAR